jgi:hypothetical protein
LIDDALQVNIHITAYCMFNNRQGSGGGGGG